MIQETITGPGSPSAGSEGSPLSDSVRRKLAAVEESIAQDVAERTKLRKFLQRIRTGWSNADGTTERLLRESAAVRLRSLYPEAGSLLEHLGADLQRQKAIRSGDLERTIRAFCAEIGYACQGRYPRLTVAHFIEVSIQEEKGRAKVGATSSQTLEWGKLRSVIQKEVQRVWDRPFEATKLHELLLVTYEKLHARSPSPTGYVRLRDIFDELRAERARSVPNAKAGGRLSAYYRDEFSADLSKLVRAQLQGELSGPTLDFTSIRQAEEGFSVILPSGDIATYGFVKPGR